MATYNLKYNKDDSVIRHIIIGLLADLNSKLSFWRQISNDERAIIDVPFFYAVAGDENFIKDNFLFSNMNGEGCDPDGAFADGNYDKVPRGIVNLTSFSVDPGKLVNKRNLGNYTMMNNQGLMEGYVAEFEMIPCVIGVDIEILLSSQLDMFKVTESIIKNMYKANFYHVDAGHIDDGMYRISSEYMMPDDYTQDKPIEYGFDDKENHKITFSLEISTFIPSFDFEDDIYTKFTRTVYTSGVTGNYGDPNKVALDPELLYANTNIDVPTPLIYNDVTGAKYEWNTDTHVWILTQGEQGSSYVLDLTSLGAELTTNAQLLRTSKRRKNSNRIFKFGNTSNIAEGTPDRLKPSFGDTTDVSSTDLPFNE
jgi:hypothetical protein